MDDVPMPTTSNPRVGRLTPSLDQRAVTVMARDRLHTVLRSVALDLLGPCKPGDVPDETAAWIANTTGSAADVVADTSLATLIEILETAIAGVPSEVVDRLDQAARRRDTGYY